MRTEFSALFIVESSVKSQARTYHKAMQLQPPRGRIGGQPDGECPSMSKNRLLVLGASARALCEMASREGLQVDAIDLFCDSDVQTRAGTCLKSVDFPDDLPTLAQRMEPSPWMYVGGLENYPDVVRTLAERQELLGVDAETLRRVRDPANLFSVVTGPPCRDRPPNGEDADTWLLKPFRSGGGLGIQPFRAADNSVASGNGPEECLALLQRGTHYLQQRIVGRSLSTTFLGAGARSLPLASFAALQAPATWTYLGSVGPLTLDASLQSWVEEAGSRIASEFRLPGLWGLDWILDRDGTPWALEVNPRWTATCELITLSRNWPLVTWHIDACRNGVLPVSVPANSNSPISDASVATTTTATEAWGKRILYANADLTFSLDHLAEIEKQVKQFASSDVGLHWRDLPAPGTAVHRGEPVCSLLLSGLSLETAEIAALTRLRY